MAVGIEGNKLFLRRNSINEVTCTSPSLADISLIWLELKSKVFNLVRFLISLGIAFKLLLLRSSSKFRRCISSVTQRNVKAPFHSVSRVGSDERMEKESNAYGPYSTRLPIAHEKGRRRHARRQSTIAARSRTTGRLSGYVSLLDCLSRTFAHHIHPADLLLRRMLEALKEGAEGLKLWYTHDPTSYWQKVVDTDRGKIAGGTL